MWISTTLWLTTSTVPAISRKWDFPSLVFKDTLSSMQDDCAHHHKKSCRLWGRVRFVSKNAQCSDINQTQIPDPWKSATDCTIFECKIWIYKSRRAQLVIWNSFSVEDNCVTLQSRCVYEWKMTPIKETQQPRGNTGEEGTLHSWCSCSTSSFTCSCITWLSELLCTSLITVVLVKVYFTRVLGFFVHDCSTWWIKASSENQSHM